MNSRPRPKLGRLRASALVCLAGILLLALAGPMHAHGTTAQQDPACTLCHAGHQALLQGPAVHAGEPLAFTSTDYLGVASEEDRSSATVAVRSPRAPPVQDQLPEGAG